MPLISEEIKIQLDHAKEEDEEERTVSDPLATNLGADPSSSDSSAIPGVYRASEQPHSDLSDPDKQQSDDDDSK
nr:hypothetical protein [Secundilactobacillus silagei]